MIYRSFRFHSAHCSGNLCRPRLIVYMFGLNHMNKFRFALLCMPLLLGGLSSAQAETKIGYVNAVELVETAPQGKKALKELENEFSGRERELLALRDQAVELEQSISKNSLLLKDSEKTEQTKNLVELQRRLQREQRELSEDFNLRRNEELAKLQKS